MLATALTDEQAEFDTIHKVLPPLVLFRRGRDVLPGQGRLVASHEPLLPAHGSYDRRVVYLMRDGRDVAVSYFHHVREFRSEEDHRAIGPSFSEFLKSFLSGAVDGYGPWHEHVELALDQAALRQGNVLLVRYEDLLNDSESMICSILEFLGADVNIERVRRAISSNTRDQMKLKQSRSNSLERQAAAKPSFVRQAKAGNWKPVFSDEDLQLFQDVAGQALARAGYSN